MRIRPYILAGGMSSRMGRDKAMLQLEGRTLLARAVSLLRDVRQLGPGDKATITICGERQALEGADRAIADRYPGCGPLGGVEAALSDLRWSGESEWAFFFAVDMPLMRARRIETLIEAWTLASGRDASLRAGLVAVEGRVQPLVSLVHRGVLEAVRDALDRGDYRVAPLLESCAAWCCSPEGVERPPEERGHHGDAIRDHHAAKEGDVDFLNVNTVADFAQAATLLGARGLN